MSNCKDEINTLIQNHILGIDTNNITKLLTYLESNFLLISKYFKEFKFLSTS